MSQTNQNFDMREFDNYEIALMTTEQRLEVYLRHQLYNRPSLCDWRYN